MDYLTQSFYRFLDGHTYGFGRTRLPAELAMEDV